MLHIETIQKLQTPAQLQDAANRYNWNDGFSIPIEISNHAQCDLATALELFWLAEAIVWFTGEIEADEYNHAWAAFSGHITNRILDGYYKVGQGRFSSPLSRVQVYKYLKQGVPEILLLSVNAE